MGNIVYTKDWRLWLIDHTRAFRKNTELKTPSHVTRCDRQVFERSEGARSRHAEARSRQVAGRRADQIAARPPRRDRQEAGVPGAVRPVRRTHRAATQPARDRLVRSATRSIDPRPSRRYPKGELRSPFFVRPQQPGALMAWSTRHVFTRIAFAAAFASASAVARVRAGTRPREDSRQIQVEPRRPLSVRGGLANRQRTDRRRDPRS